MKHIIFIISFIVSLSACSQEKSSIQNLTISEFASKLKNTPTKQLLDVRTPQEWNQGKIKSALGIDYNSSDFEQKTETLDKNKAIFVFCAAGGRSANAAKVLEKKGFKQIYNLSGAGHKELAKLGVN